MRAHLDYYSYLRNFDSFLNKLDLNDPQSLEITTNKKWINVHPAILVAVATLGLDLEPSQVRLDSITASSGHYLDRMGLFGILGKASPYNINSHEASGRFIPLTNVKSASDQSRFVSNIIPLLHLRPREANSVQYVLGELVRNALEHSMSDFGVVVAAQYYPAKNIVRIGIGDRGIGIRKSLMRYHPGHTDTDIAAIKWALNPGVSGTTHDIRGTSDNAGAGLFIVKSIASLTRDYFVVYSGSGVYRLLKRRKDVKSVKLHLNPDRDRNSQTDLAPKFPGTLVGIDISLDKIQEFVEILESIKTVYSGAIREKAKERYKRPRFT